MLTRIVLGPEMTVGRFRAATPRPTSYKDDLVPGQPNIFLTAILGPRGAQGTAEARILRCGWLMEHFEVDETFLALRRCLSFALGRPNDCSAVIESAVFQCPGGSCQVA